MQELPSETLQMILLETCAIGAPHVRFVCKQWDILCGKVKQNIFSPSLIISSIDMIECYLRIIPDLQNSICKFAAKKGNLTALEWTYNNGYPWSERTCYYASLKGHINILKWMRKRGCKWDVYMCAFAAKGGHFETLKWLREHGCPWDSTVCHYAALFGYLDILKWAVKNNCPYNPTILQQYYDMDILNC